MARKMRHGIVTVNIYCTFDGGKKWYKKKLNSLTNTTVL